VLGAVVDILCYCQLWSALNAIAGAAKEYDEKNNQSRQQNRATNYPSNGCLSEAWFYRRRQCF
jgi:hypothetical protein